MAIATFAAQQARILETQDGLSDTVLGHTD